MRKKLINPMNIGIACVMLLGCWSYAMGQRPPRMINDESAVRTLILDWVEAFQECDARRLAALEIQDVETVDRFGEVHRPSGRKDNEKLWSDAFEMESKKNARPTAAIDRVHFLRPDVAVVRVSWRFAEGILLADGERFPAFLEVDTYIVIKSHGSWLIATHNMQEKRP
jgi:uncharacterized protein (TIGR02246 family)